MVTQPRILVPVDSSNASQRAVAFASGLADKLGARLSFAHVQSPSGSIVELKARDENAEAMLATIAAAYPQAEVTTSIVVGGDIACAICEAFPDVIVVVGSEHAARHTGTAPSTVEALIRNAHDHPILVVGPRATQPSFDGPIAVALDGSAAAEAALLPALAWASTFDSPVQLVQVVPTTSSASDATTNDYLLSVQSLVQAGGSVAECFMVVDDDVVAGLVRHLNEQGCSLAAVSTHSRESISRLALGSVAMGLIAESPCTVCAVHPDAASPAALPAGSPADHAQLVRRDRH